MFQILKKTKVLARFYLNEIEVISIETGEKIKRSSKHKFSNDRMVIADFDHAKHLLAELTKDLYKNKRFFPRRLVVIIQQMEQFPDGLSEVERRAYRDLAEYAGAIEVIIIEHNREMTSSELSMI